MSMKKTIIAAAIGAGMATSAFAGVAASASLSNLTFQVMDLDANDGITSAYGIVPTPMSGTMTLQDATDESNGSLYQPFNAGETGTVSNALAGGSTQASWDGKSLAGSVTVTSTQPFYGGIDATVGSPDAYYGTNVTLTPHSMLLISADAVAAVQLDSVAGCSVGLNSLDNTACYPVYGSGGSVAVGMSINYNYSGMSQGGYGSFGQQLNVQASVDAAFEEPSEANGYSYWTQSGFNVVGSDQKTGKFTLAFVNTSDEDQMASLLLSVSVWATGPSPYVPYVPPVDPVDPPPVLPPVTSVPEPASAQLLLLGAGALLMAARRARRRA